ncbi:hypothetical protein PAGA_b0961 [Pseudoalteromonas agarivorans DSM 14585]|uniref:Uncharacterized protein n=1 Tax=Pseudoalteromonas agarivorans DSM 14585 TaxID=1312369 RepID=A0ACA8E3V6_9GAMM|nr:hypothetical protein PAGA_b0961 [Pseudoalteromonas agarivorans DSM 14585]
MGWLKKRLHKFNLLYLNKNNKIKQRLKLSQNSLKITNNLIYI